eukprot:Awhi_evm1s5357
MHKLYLFSYYFRKIPRDISCCNLDGLKELIASATNGIIINDSSQNYTCLTPQDNIITIDLDTNNDPSSGLSCCDYSTEFFDTTNESCEKCTATSFCSDSSTSCDGENSQHFVCNTCDFGFNNAKSSSQCEKCTKRMDCLEASTDCSPSSGNGNVLKCNVCAQTGFAPDESGICQSMNFTLDLSYVILSSSIFGQK